LSVNPDLLVDMLIAAGKILFRIVKGRGRKGDKVLSKKVDALKFTDKFIGGMLGDRLIEALSVYRETGDTRLFDDFAKSEFKDVIFVLEVSRRISTDLQIRYKGEPHYTVTYVKSLSPNELSLMALFTYKIIQLVNALHNGPTIHLYMAVPATLAFQLGQLVGIDLFKVQLYQLIEGNYHRVPVLKRKK
jgi:hypothetical protein